MPGYADFGQILQDPGKHRRGKACLYFNRLDDVDAGLSLIHISEPTRPY